MADAQEFEFDAFISYANLDSKSFGRGGVEAFVERLRAALATRLGRQPRLFIDLLLAPGDPRSLVKAAPQVSATMIILATPNWAASELCQQEFEAFAATGRPMLPIARRVDIELLPPRLREIQILQLEEVSSEVAETRLIDRLATTLASILSDVRGGGRRPVRDSGASVFYASPSEWSAPWLSDLREGEILFWIKNGQSHRTRLRRGHTVVLLAGREAADDPEMGAVIALGVLAAGADATFTDGENRRWPLMITHVFPPQWLPRRKIEAATGPLIRARGGGVHTLDIEAAKALGDLLGGYGAPSTIPLGREEAEAALAAGESIEDALKRHPYIHREDAPRREPERRDAYAQLLSDAPSENQDLLDRGALALFLARRMHLIWCEWNGYSSDPGGRLDEPPKEGVKAGDTFIAHIDAPWGGGKTTFANFVARVLNPTGERLDSGHFLKTDIAPDEADARKLAATALDGVFLRDYPAPQRLLHPPGRRPWIIVEGNAWRDQYIQPPWWQIYLNVTRSVRRAILDDARRRFAHAVKPRTGMAWRMAAVASGLAAWTRWLGTYAAGAWYMLTNVKVRRQLGLTLAAVVIVLGVYWGVLTPEARKALGDASKLKTFVDLTVTSLALLGGGLAALGTVISQSIEPELEFSTETRHLGVSDPVARFRGTFEKILRLGRRPVLLIVDDLDRCEPKVVVELLRGFQTIVRSPRLFVMILGDRKWIENAHSVAYKDLAALGDAAQPDLGVRFVEKLFQLSFTLPAMTPEMRRRYTLAQVGGAPEAAAPQQAAAAPTQVRAAAEAQASAEIDRTLEDQAIPVREREQKVSQIIVRATKAGADAPELQAKASRKLVAAAGADTAYKKEVENILAGLGPLMPGNPRQIKRIINAFAVLENVGRLYFNYQLTGVGPDGERRARRWRQLALWVALAIDRPDVWRELARNPQLLDAAFADKREAAAARKALATGLDKDGVARLEADLRRLSGDPGLQRLLGVYSVGEADDSPAELFARTRIEAAAVLEFNRIMWEPGFVVDD